MHRRLRTAETDRIARSVRRRGLVRVSAADAQQGRRRSTAARVVPTVVVLRRPYGFGVST